MGKLTISMAMFNSYVSLPEGRRYWYIANERYPDWPGQGRDGRDVHPPATVGRTKWGARFGPMSDLFRWWFHLVPIGSMYGIDANIWGHIDGKCYHIYHTWILWGCFTELMNCSGSNSKVWSRFRGPGDAKALWLHSPEPVRKRIVFDVFFQNITKDMRVLANLRRSYIWQFFLDFVGHIFSLGEDIIEQSGVCSISWCQDLFGQEIVFRDKV